MPGRDGKGPSKGGGKGKGWGQGKGYGGGQGSGPGGECVCPNPNCGYREPHIAGQPCNQKTCPKCGTRMVRE